MDSLLKDKEFKWDRLCLPWIEEDERVTLFFFLVISMLRFIVLHELGHIYYGHGRTDEGRLMMIVEGNSSKEDTRRKAIVSQAKEIIADSFALGKYFLLLNGEYDSSNIDTMRKLIRDKMLNSPRMRLRAILISAFLVFQLLDRNNWTNKAAKLATHPPAPFRMKALYATALELKFPKLPENEIIEEISLANTLGDAILSIGLNVYPNHYWLESIEGKEFDSHFHAIHKEMANWQEKATS